MAVFDKRGIDGFAASITDIASADLTQGNNGVLMYQVLTQLQPHLAHLTMLLLVLEIQMRSSLMVI